jgi:inosine-uridine nucleoside N-ribohydrolase
MIHTPQKRHVILTTDCGTEMDDQWAIAHLALIPEIELAGVVTTHAMNIPAPAAEFTRKASQEVLDRIGTIKPPVLAGSSVKLPDAATPLPNAGTELIVAESREHSPENRLVVLAIGAATDVASALLSDPTLKDRIEVLAMGFNGYPAGTDEWNVKNDVAAWQVILDTDVPVTIGAAEVCIKELVLDPEQARGWLNGGEPLSEYLVQLLADFVEANGEFVAKVSGRPEAWPVWDEIVVAHLLGLTTVVQVTRPRLLDDMQFDLSTPNGTAGWITEVDSEALWRDFASRIQTHG